MSCFKVPEKVIQLAGRCASDHSCIETGKCGDRPMCGVDGTLSHQISFLNTDKPVVCNYRILFGGQQLCMCPVRTFIFEHYEK